MINLNNKMNQNFKQRLLLVSALLFSLLLIGCGFSAKKKITEELNVYAAASLTDVMQKITQMYLEKYGCEININMASSGILARQIEQGGKADVYFSASKKWMDYVSELGLSNQKFCSVVAKNKLVAIVPIASKLEKILIEPGLEFPNVFEGRLSIGDPAHVPAGNYARQSLEYYHWFEPLSQRLLPAKDVRSALMMVELGEAELGIVYATDAKKSSKVKVVGIFPEESHNPIVYSAAIIGAEPSYGVIRFFEFLKSKDVATVWESYGFLNEN